MSVIDIYLKLRRYVHIYGKWNNVVLLLAALATVALFIGTVSNIKRNFDAQRNLEELQRQAELTQLEVDMLKLQQNYYKTDEYKDLAARRDLGLASPGEDVLILPKNSQAVVDEDARDSKSELESLQRSEQKPDEKQSNFNQWLDFLSGKFANSLPSDR